MDDKTYNILIVGVGGQGNILAGKIISHAFMEAGFDVKQSEVHGMAQRGGAVSSHVRAGAKIYSPLIEDECADFILSFEMLETLRYLNYAGKHTTIIMNTLRLDPPAVASGKMQYPADIEKTIARKTKNIVSIDATGIAASIGSERVANSVLVGAVASNLPLKPTVWKKVFKSSVHENLYEINSKAFEAGYYYSK